MNRFGAIALLRLLFVGFALSTSQVLAGSQPNTLSISVRDDSWPATATTAFELDVTTATVLREFEWVGGIIAGRRNPHVIAPRNAFEYVVYADADGVPGLSIAEGVIDISSSRPVGLLQEFKGAAVPTARLRPGDYWIAIRAVAAFVPPWGVQSIAQPKVGTRAVLDPGVLGIAGWGAITELSSARRTETSAETVRPWPENLEVQIVNNATNNPGIHLSLPKMTLVTIELTTVEGRRVAVVAEGSLGKGRHEFPLNDSEEASRMAAGVYFVTVRVDDASAWSRKVVVVN